jgi:hypothetical protein
MKEKVEKGKIIRMGEPSDVDFLLMQLDELTDQKSVHFNQDVFDQREEIREKILSGEIKIN